MVPEQAHVIGGRREAKRILIWENGRLVSKIEAGNQVGW